MSVRSDIVLLAGTPVETLDDYLDMGGGQALGLAYERGPEAVIDEVKRSGLRGRGGAGFPTGAKWESVRSDPHPTKYLVANGAEGEPGTFKDRLLMRRNPYQVIEGMAIAAFAIGAREAYIAMKRSFEREAARVREAIDEMRTRGILGPVPFEIVLGPDEYLFGEEKAMMEVIEGNDPMPRILPPFQEGLFSTPSAPNPTAANNVETLSNVPHILRNGADWFRSIGTESSPGTMVFTLSGDVEAPGLYELPLGIPLRTLVEEIGGGPPGGRRIKTVISGASTAVLLPEHLDLPMDFDSLRQIDAGLGSAGFIVYDDSTCIVEVLLQFARFLYIESCAQCPPCKLNSAAIVEALERIERGEGTQADIGILRQRAIAVTDGRRCALPVGQSLLVQSIVNSFTDEFLAHLGRPCPNHRNLLLPKFVDYDEAAGAFVYDEKYPLKLPDWTYRSE